MFNSKIYFYAQESSKPGYKDMRNLVSYPSSYVLGKWVPVPQDKIGMNNFNQKQPNCISCCL